jgi:GcvH upstream region-like protein
MLEFFRVYQQFFFLMITTMIIFSFSFFGTFSTFTDESEVKDRTIGKAIDGSDLKFFELQKLAQFIATDAYDLSGSGMAPNFLNDGVVRKDFLADGLADLLVKEYFDVLKEDLQTRLSHAERYHPYAHPDAPFLSVQAVWNQFNPALTKELAALQAEQENSPAIFSHLSQLYLQQGRLSPELLRRILMYQMQQYSSLRPDPHVQYGDFSLFGYHTLQDWFGRRFLDLTAQFISNTAIMAKEQGFAVSDEETKADLLLNFEHAMERLAQHKQTPISFQQQLKLIGMDEKEAIEAWKKVLLFRRHFQGLGDAVLVDTLPFRDVSNFAKEAAVVQAYTLPDSLVLKSSEDLFALQYYLDTVAVVEKDFLALPAAYQSLEKIEKKSPEFIETVFKAKIKQLSKREISLKASLKEIAGWQADHWDLLTKQFSSLSNVGNSRQERFEALDRLDPVLRAQIDFWSRLNVVDLHPEWVEEGFQAVSSKEQLISLSSNRVNLPFIQAPEKFGQLLHQAVLGDEEALRHLSSYSDGESTLCHLEEIQKISDRQIKTFAAMQQDGTLKELLYHHLEKKYANVRNKNVAEFQTADGEWKPFSQVKEAVGWVVYSNLQRAIDAEERTENKPIDWYVSHRLAGPMREAAQMIQETQSEPKWLEQFKLVRQEKKIYRTAQENWMNTEAFIFLPNQWSPVHVPPTGQIVFFYLQEKIAESEPIFPQMQLGKETIAREVKGIAAKQLIHRIRTKQAIILPMEKDEDHV